MKPLKKLLVQIKKKKKLRARPNILRLQDGFGRATADL